MSNNKIYKSILEDKELELKKLEEEFLEKREIGLDNLKSKLHTKKRTNISCNT